MTNSILDREPLQASLEELLRADFQPCKDLSFDSLKVPLLFPPVIVPLAHSDRRGNTQRVYLGIDVDSTIVIDCENDSLRSPISERVGKYHGGSYVTSSTPLTHSLQL